MEWGRIEEAKSPFTMSRKTDLSSLPPFSVMAVDTVCEAALQAKLLMSVPRVSMSCRPNMLRALAATKANTTPEPTPTSSTSGGTDDSGKRFDKNAHSLTDDKVSSKRYESSAGSYTRSKQTCVVDGVGSMLSSAELRSDGRKDWSLCTEP